MDVVGSEIGQKMRSAIKAKLTELGCYVDDELPDYVMVMVANKRTRSQMEEDLQLFLGDNTVVFVNWLHQVLKKLQEVTVTTPSKPEPEKPKEKSKSKEKKAKDKKGKEKDKSKKSELTKKAKKKDKANKKKEKIEKKKSKKKNKHHEMIHPNVPPLLMNMEKVSEPSITDVFAGQILKNHGVIIDTPNTDVVDKKPVVAEIKRSMLPIIDPKTIASQSEASFIDLASKTVSTGAIRDDQIKEMNDIEAKIAGLKQKLQEQLDSMSDDEDFLNIRTEAEELMNDFAEDVYQEISQTAPKTPPLAKKITPLPLPKPAPPKPVEVPKEKPQETEALPLIELRLPKRPIRERLGAKDANKTAGTTKVPDKRADSPERFTPEREPGVRPSSKSAKSRLGDIPERKEREEKVTPASEESSDKPEITSKRLTSKVSVRVRPRIRAPASSLLLRAVADAHKSLLNIPPKVEKEPSKIKRGIVLPMRRCVDPQKIVIQVPQDTQDNNSDNISLGDVEIDSEDEGKLNKKPKVSSKDEYIPTTLFKKFINTDYFPSRRMEDRLEKKEELNLDPIIIHNPTVGKEKDTQFIVTMEGFNPNAFLAKKLMTEGILDDDETPLVKDTTTNDKKEPPKATEKEKPAEQDKQETQVNETVSRNIPKKRLSDTSEESDTQVIIKPEERVKKNPEVETAKLECPAVKKRKASPIVFDVSKKGVETVKRKRNDSVSSDSHVTVSTNVTTHKYDTLPALSSTERKTVPCRSFPLCRFGSSCAFVHPRCKFAHLCTRTNCLYEHPPAPSALASHVVPAANYKSISSTTLPNMCKYYPGCSNPGCHYYHPKPCRYGKACLNKLECNFYHSEVTSKWKFAA